MRFFLLCSACVVLSLGVAAPGSTTFTYARSDFAVIQVITVPELGLPNGAGHPLCDLQFSPDGNTVYLMATCETPGPPTGVYSASVTRNSSGDVTGFGSFTLLFAPPSDTFFSGGLEMAPGTTQPAFFSSSVTRTDIASRGPTYEYGILQFPVATNADEVTDIGLGYRGSAVEFLPFAGDAANDPRTILQTFFGSGEVWAHTVTPDGGGVFDDTFTVNPDGTLWADLSTSVGTDTMGDLEILTQGHLAGYAVVARFYGGVDVFPLNGSSDAPAEGTTVSTVEKIAFGNDAWGVEQDPVTGDLWIISYFAERSVPDPDTLPTIVVLRSALFADGFERGNSSEWQ